MATYFSEQVNWLLPNYLNYHGFVKNREGKI